MERFIDIKGYEGLYQIGDKGTVISCGNDKTRKEKILKPGKTTKGYLHVCLYKNDGHQKFKLIHILVMENFIGPVPEGYEVNHRKGNKSDNRLFMLEYATPSQNTQHAHDTGLIIRRRSRPGKKRKYKGAYLIKNRKKPWRAVFSIGRHTIQIGYYYTEKEAALAYNRAVLEACGGDSSKCRLNVIE